MKKLILRWLFGTSDLENYCELLHKDNERIKQLVDLSDLYLETLAIERENLDIMRKLIKVLESM